MTSTLQFPKRLEEHGIKIVFAIEKPIVTISHDNVNDFTVDFTDEKASLTNPKGRLTRGCRKETMNKGEEGDWYFLRSNNGIYTIRSRCDWQVIDPNGKPIFKLDHFPQRCPTISPSGRYISYVICSRVIEKTKSILIDLQDQKIFEYIGLPANFSPDEKYFAYPLVNEVFVCTTKDKKLVIQHSFSKYNPHINTVLLSNTHIVIIWRGLHGTIKVMKIGEKNVTHTDQSAYYHIHSHLYSDGTLLSVGTDEIKKIKFNFEEPKIESVPPNIEMNQKDDSVPSNIEMNQKDDSVPPNIEMNQNV